MKKKVRLGDVCTVISGTTPKTGNSEYWNGNIPWITPAELTNDSFYIYDTARKITTKAVSEKSLKSFPEGTVILSSRAPIGKVAVAGIEMYCNQGFKNLICNEKLYNEYLYWFLKGKKNYLNSLGRGATFKEISKGIVQDVEIPLPEMKDQLHISSVLNKLQNLMQLKKDQLGKYDVLIKSRFVELFGDTVKNTLKWETKQLNEVGELKSGGTPRRSNLDYFTGDINWYSAGELNYLYLPDSKEKITNCAISESSAKIFKAGSLLIGMYDTAAFKMGILKSDSTSNQACANILPFEALDIIWLYYNLSHMKEYFLSNRRGIRQKNLNLGMIKEFEIPVPPIKLQNGFSNFVKHVDKLKVEVQKSLDETQILFDSLMQEYFD